jgi:hypothetical protein
MVRSAIKQESILGFYKGMSSPIFDVTIINGIVFSIQNLEGVRVR